MKRLLFLFFVCFVKSSFEYGSIPSNNNLKYVVSRKSFVWSNTRARLYCENYPIESIENIVVPPAGTPYNQYVKAEIIMKDSFVETIKIDSNHRYFYGDYVCVFFNLAEVLKENFNVTFNVFADNTLFGLIPWPNRKVPLIDINSQQHMYVQFYNETHVGVTIDYHYHSYEIEL